MPPLREIPALDGMRGVAALLVVGFHAVVFAVGLPPGGPNEAAQDAPSARLWLGWGFIGVDFFFVLSAFLLSQPFLSQPFAEARRGYAAKRLLRILPPYYASLLLGWLLVGRTGHPWFEVTWRQLWTHLTFTHGFWPDTQFSVSAVYWTLAVELQFYLLLPLLVLPFRTRWWPWALAASFAVALAYRAWSLLPGDPAVTRFHDGQLPGYLGHFALGIALARARHRARESLHGDRWLDAGIVAALVAFIVVPSILLRAEPRLFGLETPMMVVAYRPLVAVGFGLAILLATSGEGWVARALSSRPLTALGRWSYSLYLVHYAVGAWLVLQAPALLDLPLSALALVVSAASLVAAALFHAAAEAPFLRLRSRLVGWASRRGRPEPPAALPPAPKL